MKNNIKGMSKDGGPEASGLHVPVLPLRSREEKLSLLGEGGGGRMRFSDKMCLALFIEGSCGAAAKVRPSPS